MANTYKFPNGGYDVTVLKKQDILDCIDDNIIDKEVALAIVEQCEIDAANFLMAGRWTGIPYLGNIRIPKFRQILNSPETRALIAEAKENLDADKYILFRSNLAAEAAKHSKMERYFRYEVSKFVTKNMQFYRTISERHGNNFAYVLMFTLREMTIVDEYYKF